MDRVSWTKQGREALQYLASSICRNIVMPHKRMPVLEGKITLYNSNQLGVDWEDGNGVTILNPGDTVVLSVGSDGERMTIGALHYNERGWMPMDVVVGFDKNDVKLQWEGGVKKDCT